MKELVLLAALLGGQPQFEEIKPLRKAEKIGILGDIESHLSKGNTYTSGNASRLTDVHEGTHGINSTIRAGSTKYNGFYLLNNQSIRIQEPNITIKQVKLEIPASFKRECYKYNLEQFHTLQWNKQPLYIVDEWTAYTNGAEYLVEVKDKFYEICPISMVDLNVFAFALLKSLPADYEDRQKLVDFVQYQTNRVYQLSEHFQVSQEEWLKFRLNADCAPLRKFLIDTYGEEWANAKRIKE